MTQATTKKRVTTKKRKTKKLEEVVWYKKSGIIAGFVVLVVVTIGLGALAISNKVTQMNAQDAARTPRTNKNIGVMNFSWMDDMRTISGQYKPEDGYKVVAVSTEILNLSQQSLWLAPTVESYISDPAGTRYGMALADVTKPFAAGIYEPQQTASGQLTYAIPASSQDMEWCYELADSNGGGVPICLPLNTYTQSSSKDTTN